MALRSLVIRGSAAGMAGLALLACIPAALAGPFYGCCKEKCPPKFVHCMEGRPKLKFKCGCPKPVCDPCNLEHYGYYRTCWQPWPWGPNWSHCCVPPPGEIVHREQAAMGMMAPQIISVTPLTDDLHSPRKLP